MMVIGYDANGNPILAPSNNAAAVAPMDAGEQSIEPPLPTSEDFEANLDMINGQPPNYQAPGKTPAAVVNDVSRQPEVRAAEPVMKPTGAFMDTGFIQQINNAATDEEAKAMYDALDPALKHVYDRSYNMQISPQWAAQTAQEFYKMQDERAKAQNQDPAKAREAAQQAARVQSVIGIMDTYAAPDSDLESLVGPAAGSWAANEWDKWNNPDRYSKRFELSFTTKSEVLEAAKFVKPLSNDERKFLEEMFPRRDDPPQVWRSYFKRTRDILSQGLPQQPQQQGAAPAAAPASQGAAQPPNLPPTRIDPVTGQTMQLIQNQQGRWVYRMATQQQSQPNVTGR